MITRDYHLYMKFQRQPRVLGTKCIYAPSNKLLVPPGIKPGDAVFICDYTQSGDDVYVTVCDMAYWRDLLGWSDKACGDAKREYIAKIPKDEKIMVIWKDLAQ